MVQLFIIQNSKYVFYMEVLTMRDLHKEKVIKTAIQEYKNSVLFGFSSGTAQAINMMEEARYMCAPFNIEGIAELEKTIKEAKKKYKDKLK